MEKLQYDNDGVKENGRQQRGGVGVAVGRGGGRGGVFWRQLRAIGTGPLTRLIVIHTTFSRTEQVARFCLHLLCRVFYRLPSVLSSEPGFFIGVSIAAFGHRD